MSSPPSPRRRHCRNFAVILILLLTPANTHADTRFSGCFDAIFSFGDSLADTGNAFISDPNCSARKHPYGQTHFKRPNGRFSDGRLIVDFIAEAVGLPYLRPYLQGGNAEDFRHGANFAVAGATALDNSFFRDRAFVFYGPEYSLGAQIEQFKQLFRSMSISAAGLRDILSNSLVLMGEIGGNDYNYAFVHKRTIDEIQTYVPSVVAEISSAIIVLIELGAKTILVPGNLPIGCSPCYLTDFRTESANEYDLKTGCINWLNEYAEYHNNILLDELDRLRKRYPDIIISYADYYRASMVVFRDPEQYGFKSPLVACCGVKGLYNYNFSAWCGEEGTEVCDDSSAAFCWDGAHLTEAGYRVIANGLIDGGYASPPFLRRCLSLKQCKDEL